MILEPLFIKTTLNSTEICLKESMSCWLERASQEVCSSHIITYLALYWKIGMRFAGSGGRLDVSTSSFSLAGRGLALLLINTRSKAARESIGVCSSSFAGDCYCVVFATFELDCHFFTNLSIYQTNDLTK